MAEIPINPRSTCYFGCNEGGPLHHFPKPDRYLEKFNDWKAVLKNVIKEKDDKYIYNQLRLCNKHFENYYILPSNRLTRNAVPTLYIKEGSPSLPKSDKCESKLINQTDIEGQSNQAVPRSPVNIVYSWQQQRFATVVPGSKDPDDANEDRAVDIAAADNAPTPSPVGAGEPSTAEEGTDDNDAVYTWQRDALVVPCDEPTGTIDMDLTELDSEPEPSAVPMPGDEDEDLVHEGLKCNHCHGDIVGFRYTCVQCADYDLCGACEARREHRRHYALRLPAPRPYEEIQTVLLAIRRALSNSFLEVRCDGLPVEVKEESDPFGEVNTPTELLEYENECIDDCHTDLEEHAVIEMEQTDTEETHTVIDETHKAVDAVDSDRLEEQILTALEEENMNIECVDSEDDLNMKSVETFQLERSSSLKSRVTHTSTEFIPKIVLSSVKSNQSHPVKLLLTTEKVDNIPKETVAWVQSKVMRGRSATRRGATVAPANTARTESTRDSQDCNTPKVRVLVRRLNEEQLSLYVNRRTKRGRPYRGWPP